MIVEILIVCCLAKFRHYKLRYLFYSWVFYPVLIVQLALLVFQASVFFGSYYFVRFASLMEFASILSFIFAILLHRLYTPAIVGSISVLAGTALNKLALAQNGGKMPVFPSLSYITGYIDRGGELGDSLHILGGETTKLKILADYIDFGYSILSVGDVLIHMFSCIMLYYLIKSVNLPHQNMNKTTEKG